MVNTKSANTDFSNEIDRLKQNNSDASLVVKDFSYAINAPKQEVMHQLVKVDLEWLITKSPNIANLCMWSIIIHFNFKNVN